MDFPSAGLVVYLELAEQLSCHPISTVLTFLSSCGVNLLGLVFVLGEGVSDGFLFHPAINDSKFVYQSTRIIRESMGNGSNGGRLGHLANLKSKSAVVYVNVDLKSIAESDFKVSKYVPQIFVQCHDHNGATRTSQDKKLPSHYKAMAWKCRRNLVDCFAFSESQPSLQILHSINPNSKCPTIENYTNLKGANVTALLPKLPMPHDPNYFNELDSYMLDAACEFLNCRLNKAIRNAGFGSRLPNGTWTGIMGMMSEANCKGFCLTVLVASEERKAAVDFTSGPLYDTYNVLVSRKPMEVRNVFVTLQPFEAKAWMSIFGSVFAVSLTLHVLNHFRTNADQDKFDPTCLRNDKKYTFVDFLGENFRHLVYQASEQRPGWPPSATRSRLASAGYQLCIVVLTIVYSSMLTAMLAIPTYTHPIDTLQDVAAYRGTVITHSLGGYAIDKLKSDLRELPVVGLEQRPTQAIPYQEIFNNEQPRVYTNAYSVVELLMNAQVGSDFMQEFHVSKRTFYHRIYAFACKKDSPFFRYFERFSNLYAQTGLSINNEKQIYKRQKGRYLEDLKLTEKKTRQIDRLLGPFLLYIAGMTVATISFITELLYWRLKSRIH